MSRPTHKIGCLKRRAFLGSALACALPVAAQTRSPSNLPPSRSLQDELHQSVSRRHPLVVMVSLDGCPFCKVVRERYLQPLVKEQGLQIVQIDMQSPAETRDFHGTQVTHGQLVKTWGIRVAPTVLFWGPGGIYLEDFYQAYLQDRLDHARARVAAG
jgi:thioredoxin-related protein